MQRYYNDHYITARAELDSETGLFRAVIMIKPVIADDFIGRILRHPDKGIFVSEGAAELYGVLVAQEWVDKLTSRVADK
jgi:hypothetical protein